MNYLESAAIKQKIDASQRILVNCHHNPDADSIGSALAMARVLKQWGKEVTIISPTDVPSNLKFLLREDTVETIDFKHFDYSKFDLFITLDSSSWSRVCGEGDLNKPDISLVVIDHHKSNSKFGEINLVVPEAAANCEVLFYLFKDWQIDIKIVSEPLLAGIMGDTGALRFPEAGRKTFEVAAELMNHADKNNIIFSLYQSFGENHIMVWKEIMNNLAIDHEHKFVYSFIRREMLEKYGKPFNAKSELADILFQSIEGTDFGLVGAEDDGYISVSFRSRTGVDVSALASTLGGGGHAWASAARVYNKSYEEAVEKILLEARNFSRQQSLHSSVSGLAKGTSGK